MNEISAQRPSLYDLPHDCIGAIANQLVTVSDQKRPLCRSLLRWSATSKDMQAQLADWTTLHANPGNHAVEAFKDIFCSEVPIRRLLPVAKAFAMHLTADQLSRIAFFQTNDGQRFFVPEHLALTLIALAHVRKDLPQGAAAGFHVELTQLLAPKVGGMYVLDQSHKNNLKSVVESIFASCGVISSANAPKTARVNACARTLFRLPQPMKAMAMEFVLSRPSILDSKEFKNLFLTILPDLLPDEWDNDFMGSMFGAAILNACDAALNRFGFSDRCEDFILACSRLFGRFISALPVEQRNVRILCEMLPECRGLYTGLDESYSGRQDYDSDDSNEGLSGAQMSLKDMLGRIFDLLHKWRFSKLCNEAFIRDFVDTGFLSPEEFDLLTTEFVEDAHHVRSFFDFTDLLREQERHQEPVEKKSGKRLTQKCVIS